MKTAMLLTFALVFLVTDDVATGDRAWEPRAEIQSALRPALPADATASDIASTDLFNRDVHGTGGIVIGRVSDIVLSPVTGRITGLIVGVGEKDVEIPIGAVAVADRQNRNHLVIEATRQSLRDADAVRFDGATSQWVAVAAPSL